MRNLYRESRNIANALVRDMRRALQKNGWRFPRRTRIVHGPYVIDDEEFTVHLVIGVADERYGELPQQSLHNSDGILSGGEYSQEEDADSHMIESMILVEKEKNTPEFVRREMPGIVTCIVQNVRHELEHIFDESLQGKTRHGISTLSQEVVMAIKKNSGGILDYYLLDYEIRAFVADIFHIARRNKVPISSLLHDFFRMVRRDLREDMPTYSDEEIDKMFSAIVKQYNEYIKGYDMSNSVLLESTDDEAQASMKSEVDDSFIVTIIFPNHPVHKLMKNAFEESHAFLIPEKRGIIIDGDAVMQPWFTPEHMLIIQAHEIAHYRLGHRGHGDMTMEREADKFGIDILRKMGEDGAVKLYVEEFNERYS